MIRRTGDAGWYPVARRIPCKIGVSRPAWRPREVAASRVSRNPSEGGVGSGIKLAGRRISGRIIVGSARREAIDAEHASRVGLRVLVCARGPAAGLPPVEFAAARTDTGRAAEHFVRQFDPVARHCHERSLRHPIAELRCDHPADGADDDSDGEGDERLAPGGRDRRLVRERTDVAGRRSANDRRQVNVKRREAERLATRPVAPVVVRYVCPRCGGPHPAAQCPRRLARRTRRERESARAA